MSLFSQNLLLSSKEISTKYHPNSKDSLSSYEMACSDAVCNSHQRKGASLSPEISAPNLPSLIQGTHHAHGILLMFSSPLETKISHRGRPTWNVFLRVLHTVYNDNDIMTANTVPSISPPRNREMCQPHK